MEEGMGEVEEEVKDRGGEARVMVPLGGFP